jgi:hypothetical protein
VLATSTPSHPLPPPPAFNTPRAAPIAASPAPITKMTAASGNNSDMVARQRHQRAHRHPTSRRHARIARDPSGQLTIEDLGSANGTFVNGERVSGRHVLKVGDSVEVGSTTLQLTDGELRDVMDQIAAHGMIYAIPN